MTTTLRPIEALSRIGETADPGKAPEVLFLTLGQLRINDAYQRALTKSSQNGIRKMAKTWDWNRYTPISVAATGQKEVYEVTDGQRRAIAAASNGGIHILPCYLTTAKSLEEKAASFVGVNMGRVGLTPAEIYKGKVAAGDDVANAVQRSLDAAGCTLLTMPPSKGFYSVGDTMAVGTLMKIAEKAGEERLAVLLQVCKKAAAAPVSSCVLKALDLAIPWGANLDDKATIAVTRVLGGQGATRLEMIAKKRTPEGKRSFDVLADDLADMAKLSAKRLGLKSRGKDGRVPEAAKRQVGKRHLSIVPTIGRRARKAA